MKKKNNNHL